jgi:serine/threonine protein phosphatase PrpC
MGIGATREKFLNKDMADLHFFATNSLELAVYSTKGLKRGKKKNEDSCGFVTQGQENAILIVADGMGGHQLGDKASSVAVSSIVGRALQRKRLLKPNDVRLRIEKAHKKILDFGVDAGTTLVCAQIQGQSVRFYCIGDSMGALFNKNGEIFYKTVEHSVKGFATRSGILSESEANQRSDGHEILNCLGFHDSRIEMSFELNFQVGDTLFLCSDGVTDFLNTKDIATLINQSSLKEGAQAIIAKTSTLKSQYDSYDDLSFIVAKKIS